MEILCGIKGQLRTSSYLRSSENIGLQVNSLEKTPRFTLQPYHLERPSKRILMCTRLNATRSNSFNFQPLMGEKSFHLVCTLRWNSQEKNCKLQEVISLAEFKGSSRAMEALLWTVRPLSLRLSPADFLDGFENAILWQYFIVCLNLSVSCGPLLNPATRRCWPSWFSSNSLLWET